MDSSPYDEAKRNKLKNCVNDAVTIAGNNIQHGIVSSHAQYPNVYDASRNINKPFDKMTESTIKGSHFKTGYNNDFHSTSENAGKFFPQSAANNRLPSDRIEFFKGTHHQIGNPSWGMMGAEP